MTWAGLFVDGLMQEPVIGHVWVHWFPPGLHPDGHWTQSISVIGHIWVCTIVQ